MSLPKPGRALVFRYPADLALMAVAPGRQRRYVVMTKLLWNGEDETRDMQFSAVSQTSLFH
jgi:hypothetical protein